MNDTIISKLNEGIPVDKIRKKPGGGGQSYRYVKGIDVIQMLNEIFGYRWDFRIIHTSRDDDEIIAHVQISCYDPEINEGAPIIKEGIDSAAIKFFTSGSNQGKPVSIGDAYKSAVTGALKKAASLLNIGLDLYEDESPPAQAGASYNTYNKGPTTPSKPAEKSQVTETAPPPEAPAPTFARKSFSTGERKAMGVTTTSATAAPSVAPVYPKVEASESITEVQIGAIEMLAETKGATVAQIVTELLGAPKEISKLSRAEGIELIKKLREI